MAITKSAKKALRQTKRRRVMNVSRIRTMKDAVKAVRTSSAKGVSAESLSEAYKAIDKAAKRGIIKKNTAARKKSQVARMAAGKTK
ncbi:MAG TPA: 30S ribosomal protein S20 [Candidatus Paceibacterota bacterium]